MISRIPHPGHKGLLTNQIMAGSGQRPLSVNASRGTSGDVFLSHREFISNVFASTTATVTNGTALPTATNLSTFTNITFPINTGLANTFPWLSQLAQNFTLYELQGLIFEYRPTSGEFGNLAGNSLGKVIMATDYDPDATPFTSSVQMENYDYATSCKPSQHMAHGVETKRTQTSVNMMYVRTGNVSRDKVFTDLGLFQIATEGVPVTTPAYSSSTASGTYTTNAAIGELWVTYKVKLSRATLYGSIQNSNVGNDYFLANNINGATIANGTQASIASVPALNSRYSVISVPTAIGYAFATKATNNIGCQVIGTTPQALSIIFPQNVVEGYYGIVLYVVVAANANNSAWQLPTIATTPPTAGITNLGTGTIIGSANPNAPDAAPMGITPIMANFNAGNTSGANNSYSINFWVQIAAPGLQQTVVNCTMNAVINGASSNPVWVANIWEVPSTFFT